ncbi:MAG: MBL fold metallo-hydrolase [Bacteroidales bacterium]|jgi:ribonuclease BN (tRNA processing enzyme)|nr:MBL fold metallo-hydrolase [Bacteroidales bacterium]
MPKLTFNFNNRIACFHPVGQGLFFHCEFHSEDNVYIYDIGTSSKSKYIKHEVDELISRLKNFKKEPIITIFISHFHADHCNHLQYFVENAPPYKIDIILPYYSGILSDKVTRDFYSYLIGITDTNKNESVYKKILEAYASENNTNQYVKEKINIHILKDSNLESLNCLKPIKDKICFSYKEASVAEIEKIRSQITQMLGNMKVEEYFKKRDYKKLTKIYEDAFGENKLNEYSLIVGLKVAEDTYILLTGDANMSDLCHNTNYKYFSGITPIDYTKFSGDILRENSICLVAHHGEYDSNKSSVFFHSSNVNVISYGTNNSHRHPNPKLLVWKRNIFLVNEEV